MTVLGTDFAAAAPVILAIAVLIALCKWVFGGRGVRQVVARPDYGLLSPVIRTGSAAEAESIRAELAGHGIRGTVAPAGKGFDSRGVPWPADAHVVLVFPADVERATSLVVTGS
jgi:hypothetical protein